MDLMRKGRCAESRGNAHPAPPRNDILPVRFSKYKLHRGVLGRSHIVANAHRHIGKETSRRWEQGDDIDLVDFVSSEYAEKMVAADSGLKDHIRELGIRKTARLAKIDSKTVMLIVRGGRVKRKTLHCITQTVNALLRTPPRSLSVADCLFGLPALPGI